jgi:hypothetical protein
MGNLLKDKYPEIFAKLHPTLNTHLNVNTITCGSAKKAWFCCEKCSQNYETTIYNITKRHKFYCKECVINSTRSFDKKEKDEAILKYKPNPKSMKIGDEKEKFIYELLVNTKLYKNVELVGSSGEEADIIITLENDIKKPLQIKTLTTHYSKNCNKSFSCKTRKYTNNILMALIDNTFQYFVLDFSDNLFNNKCSCFNFDKYNHSEIMYNNKNIFLDELIKLIPQSNDYIFKASPSTTKEFNSLKRLNEFCKKNNLSFERNKDTTNTTVDCFIEGIPIQCKFNSFPLKGNNVCEVSSKKYACSLNYKKLRMPYSANDPFEYIIIEIGGNQDNPNIYLNNFCIIPKSLLIERNILLSDSCKGKTKFCICIPDYKLQHWSKIFWYKEGDKIKVQNGKLVRKSKLVIV